MKPCAGRALTVWRLSAGHHRPAECFATRIKSRSRASRSGAIAVRNGDAPARLVWSSGRVQPHSSIAMGADRSAFPYLALWVNVLSRWTGALWRWVICLGVRWPRRLTLTLLDACVTKPSKDDISAGARDTFTGAASTSTLNKIASAAPKPAPASL